MKLEELPWQHPPDVPYNKRANLCLSDGTWLDIWCEEGKPTIYTIYHDKEDVRTTLKAAFDVGIHDWTDVDELVACCVVHHLTSQGYTNITLQVTPCQSTLEHPHKSEPTDANQYRSNSPGAG